MRYTKLLAIAGLSLTLFGTTAALTQSTSPAPAPAAAPQKSKLVAPSEFSRQFIDVAKAVRPAVVSVTSTSVVDAQQSPFEGSPFEFFFRGLPRGGEQAPRRRQGMGSGVIVDAAKGYILTNNHVVQDADELKVVLADDREFVAEIVGTDPNTDVAVIKLKDAGKLGLSPAPLGNSDALQVGEWVMAIGSPFGLKQTVSAGIVSAVGRGRVGIADYEDFVQTDAAINPGNSGGPLVNLEGRVVGINTAIASQSGGYQGVGFAIPVNMARTVMDQLIAHGAVVRGYMGVYITDVSEELARSFNYKGQGGVLVQDVSPDGPAAKAGLKAGDIITQRDGKPIHDVVVFRNAIAQTAPGSQVTLTAIRDGKEVALKVKLEELPAQGEARQGMPGRGGPAATKQGGRGIELSDMTPDLKRRLQTKLDAGAVVTGVAPDSPAGTAGLQPGDVIVQIGEDPVKTAADAAKLLGKVEGKPVRLRVVREGHGMFLILPPPAKK
jgi:serine protease Do